MHIEAPHETAKKDLAIAAERYALARAELKEAQALLREAALLALDLTGRTEKDIADRAGITRMTLRKWQGKNLAKKEVEEISK